MPFGVGGSERQAGEPADVQTVQPNHALRFGKRCRTAQGMERARTQPNYPDRDRRRRLAYEPVALRRRPERSRRTTRATATQSHARRREAQQMSVSPHTTPHHTTKLKPAQPNQTQTPQAPTPPNILTLRRAAAPSGGVRGWVGVTGDHSDRVRTAGTGGQTDVTGADSGRRSLPAGGVGRAVRPHHTAREGDVPPVGSPI